MQKIVVAALGEARILCAGKEILPPTRKSKALPVSLALSPGGSHTREHLAGMFWGRSAEPRARASLRQTLSSLRKELGGEAGPPATDGGRALPDLERCDVDVREFESLAASGDIDDLGSAADLYRGDFLEGFSLPEEAFEERLRFRRGR